MKRWRHRAIATGKFIAQLFDRTSPEMLFLGAIWFAGMAIALPHFFRLLLWSSPVFQVLLGVWAVIHMIVGCVNLRRSQ